jgi:Icc protein
MAIDNENALNPNFVLTGGDLVYVVMRGDYLKVKYFSTYTKVWPCVSNACL